MAVPPQCSRTCGPGTKRRAVACTADTGVPCDEAERPPSQAPCLLRPCLQGLDLPDPDGSGSGGFFSRDLDNEVDFVPRHPVHLPPPEAPTGQGNAIGGDGPQPGPPGPVWVDDFYYDYNFIRFHENLSQGEDEGEDDKDPGLSPVGTGAWASPPPQSGPAEPPTQPPAPRPSQASPRLPPRAGPTPWDPLLNVIPEADAPTGTPAPGLPSSPWPLAPVEATPATPGGHEGSPAPSWPPRPRWESTNEVPEEDEDGALGPPDLPLPGIPESPTLSSARPRLRPDSEELWVPVGRAPPAASLPDAHPGPAPAVPSEHEPGATPLSPAGDGPSYSSSVPLGPPPTRNASWEVGDWSQASVGGIATPVPQFPCRVVGRLRGPHLPVALGAAEALPGSAQRPLLRGSSCSSPSDSNAPGDGELTPPISRAPPDSLLRLYLLSGPPRGMEPPSPLPALPS